MKKSNYLKTSNSATHLLKFFFYETVNGFFSNNFFSKKINRYIFISCVIIIYIAYVSLNFIESGNISNMVSTLSNDERPSMQRFFFSSILNMLLIMAINIYVFIKSTVKLTKTSLFLSKTLPIELKFVQKSIRLYNLIVYMIMMELIIIVIIPSFKLITDSIVYLIFYWLAIHIFLIFVYDLLEIVHLKIINIYMKYLNKNYFKKINLFLAVIILIASFFHFTRGRIFVDDFISHLNYSSNSMIAIFLLLSMMGSILCTRVVNATSKKDDIFFERKYPVIFSKIIKLPATLIPIVRNNAFIYYVIVVFLYSIILLVQGNIDTMLSIYMYVLPLIAISSLNYGDATNSFRRFFVLYGISRFNEFLSLVTITIILNIPSLILSLSELRSITHYIFTICLFLSGIILGIIFPNSKSNINETISSLMLCILFILFILLANINGLLYPVLVIILLSLNYVLKKQYEIPI